MLNFQNICKLLSNWELGFLWTMNRKGFSPVQHIPSTLSAHTIQNTIRCILRWKTSQTSIRVENIRNSPFIFPLQRSDLPTSERDSVLIRTRCIMYYTFFPYRFSPTKFSVCVIYRCRTRNCKYTRWNKTIQAHNGFFFASRYCWKYKHRRKVLVE